MIYTLTLNPSVDCTIRLPELKLGQINRSDNERLCAAGKGVNVSIMLKNLGVQSCAAGFVSGFTGDFVEQSLKGCGVDTLFTHTESGVTRVNVKIRHSDETDINARGPKISAADRRRLVSSLDVLKDGDYLVMSGSVPDGAEGLYTEIMNNYAARNVRFIIDATGQELKSALSQKPFLIKPNLDELSEVCGKKLCEISDIFRASLNLCDNGAQNVLCSLGERGAVLVTQDGGLYCPAPQITVTDTVGAGDCMLAAFIYGLISSGGAEEALKFSVAAGSACAKVGGFAAESGIISLKERLSPIVRL